MNQPLTCDIWTIVDFGKGPVEVRCTETGDHTDHICEIFIDVGLVFDNEPITTDAEHRNIFENRAS